MQRPVRLALSLVAAATLAFPTSAVAFNPDARCEGIMLSQWTVEVDPGTYDEGTYTFWWKFTGPATGGEDFLIGPMTFTVSDAVEPTRGNVLIGNDMTINPAQDGYHWAAFYWDMTGASFGPYTVPEARAELAESAIYFNVAPGTSTAVPTDWLLARGGPLASLCAGLFGSAWLHRTYPSR